MIKRKMWVLRDGYFGNAIVISGNLQIVLQVKYLLSHEVNDKKFCAKPKQEWVTLQKNPGGGKK